MQLNGFGSAGQGRGLVGCCYLLVVVIVAIWHIVLKASLSGVVASRFGHRRDVMADLAHATLDFCLILLDRACCEVAAGVSRGKIVTCGIGTADERRRVRGRCRDTFAEHVGMEHAPCVWFITKGAAGRCVVPFPFRPHPEVGASPPGDRWVQLRSGFSQSVPPASWSVSCPPFVWQA